MKKIILILVLFIFFIPTLSIAELTAIEKTIIKNYVIKFNAQLDEFKDECDTKIKDLIKEVDECTEAADLDKIKERIKTLQERLEEVEKIVEEKRE